VTSLALAFALLAKAVAADHGRPFRIDLAMHDWAVEHRPTSAAALARLATASGIGLLPHLVAIFSGWVACGVAAAWRRKVAAALGSLLALFSGELVRSSLAVAIARPRPSLADWAAPASGHAFPSGHTTTSAIAAGLLIWGALARGPRTAAWIGIALGVCWAAAVGSSRVYLGMHWPTDVLGGWLLAASWLALTLPPLSALVDRSRLVRRGRPQ
jgi:undecaprenyl-diphosphatase